MKKLILSIFTFILLLSNHSFSKETICKRGLILFGNYQETVKIKISEDNKNFLIDNISFLIETTSIYDELTKETLIALEGTKEVKNLLYVFTYVESRKLLTYSIIDMANTKIENDFTILYECLK